MVNDLADLRKMNPPRPAVGTSREAIQLKMRIPQKVQKLRAPGTLQVKVKTWIKTEVMHLPKLCIRPQIDPSRSSVSPSSTPKILDSKPQDFRQQIVNPYQFVTLPPLPFLGF